jgi:cell division protein FtsI/penicillin-binding protein 2
MRLQKNKYVQETSDGRRISFTVNAALQRYVDELFDKYDVPAGAAVVLNSRTGRVIALSQKRRALDAAETNRVAQEATAPAASLFKMVTTAALMEEGHIPLSHTTCYAGGSRKLLLAHLMDPIPNNHACVSLKTALGRSVNAVFAKLSDRHLNRRLLEEYARKFYFNRHLEFDVPVESSVASIPEDRLERARTAAGFWHTHLSPVHAAMIAQSIAQGGAMLRPYVVDRVEDSRGRTIYKARTKYLNHTVTKETAAQLIEALSYTTEFGTARNSFRDRRGRPYIPGVRVAGKTGTLTGEKPYRAYTWFTGLAPTDRPEVAIAVLVINEPKWRIKAAQMAALILKKYFMAMKR